MKDIKKYKDIKNTTDYKLALYFTEVNERHRILEILEGSKEIYKPGTKHWPPAEGYDEEDFVLDVDSEWNECVDYLIEKIKPKPVEVPKKAFICQKKK